LRNRLFHEATGLKMNPRPKRASAAKPIGLQWRAPLNAAIAAPLVASIGRGKVYVITMTIYSYKLNEFRQ
jgi:hypothetical protein